MEEVKATKAFAQTIDAVKEVALVAGMHAKNGIHNNRVAVIGKINTTEHCQKRVSGFFTTASLIRFLFCVYMDLYVEHLLMTVNLSPKPRNTGFLEALRNLFRRLNQSV